MLLVLHLASSPAKDIILQSQLLRIAISSAGKREYYRASSALLVLLSKVDDDGSGWNTALLQVNYDDYGWNCALLRMNADCSR